MLFFNQDDDDDLSDREELDFDNDEDDDEMDELSLSFNDVEVYINFVFLTLCLITFSETLQGPACYLLEE